MFNFPKKNSKTKDLEEVQKFLRGHLTQLAEKESVIPPHVFDVSKFFLEEALGMYESMAILMQRNHFRGCIPMARTLLENSINLKYIYCADTEQRAKNFKLDSIAKLLKRTEGLKFDSTEHKEMQSSFEKLVKNYVPDRKTLKEKSIEVNSHSLYKEAYSRLSEYVHSAYKTSRDFDEDRPYTAYMKRLVFSDTLIVTLEALKNICERFDLEGGFMIIEDPGYKGTVLFSTNPKREEEKKRRQKSDGRV